MSAHGFVEISSTDSISSGLISPWGVSSTRSSIALASAYVEGSRIISSSSMPTVYAGPLNFGSMRPRRVGASRFQHDCARYSTMALGYDGKLYILAFDH